MPYAAITFEDKKYKIDLEKLKLIISYFEHNEKFDFKNDDDIIKYLKKHKLYDKAYLKGLA